MNEARIIISGAPIAKKRPRFARIGKGVRTYDVQETEAGRFLLDARQQFRRPPFKGPVGLRVTFDMPRPKGHFGSGKNGDRLKPSAPARHTKKPDLDNLCKFVKDCLNGLAWEDDCQVINMIAVKRYAGDCGACTMITIEELDDDTIRDREGLY